MSLLSILVHPDKNQDDKDRAQTAFDAVNRAYKNLESEETRQKYLDIIEEAKARTENMVQEKKKKLKREGKKDLRVEEDDPERFRHAVYVMTMKMFADMERRKRELEERDMEERKRKREEEIEEEEKKKVEKEFQKNFEESRQERVTSWKDFQEGSKKKKKKVGGFRPPKHKMETR
ncbi:unnamed protein product [Darwinula stevensoni]|uniref:J domain-containing protein n=1 Tax=Darwinula stevensoni TaxID=69355 RepID=A0A7R8XB67_9CRUS|nr:unnamed protein product [Darwinula stevensoni]CAG0892071.1 unnamed protein product [Darwinula stevensoni]